MHSAPSKLPTPFFLFSILYFLFPTLTAFADTVTTIAGTSDGTITGLRNGKLSLTTSDNKERQFDPADITALSFSQNIQFNTAEAVRDDALKSSALYKALITSLNKPEFKLLAQARAIDPLDRNDHWSEAVDNFLDVYLSAPTDSIWKLRPTHMPGPASSMLTESAKRVEAAVNQAKTDEARKTLRRFLVEIYTHAGDTAAAARVSRAISGLPDEPPATATAPAPDPALAAAIADLETALKNKQYDRVIAEAGKFLTTARGDAAVRLFSLQARAWEAQGKADLAAAAWLRIPAHYPDSPLAPAALDRAAELQQTLGRADAAKAIRDERQAQYPPAPK